MPHSNVCWGIEIGAGAIKAIKLVRDGQNVTVADFAVVPHAKVLSSPDVDQADALRVALGTLVTQVDLSKAMVAISVPGHAAFARFAKLPPVEPKKVPDIVKFEAVQQIPFPIDQVEWDYQTFLSPESPDVEVGIFAITRERVMERLALCNDVGLQPDYLNISPVCAYNAVAYDLAFTENTPGTVILDIGTTATDLVVAEAGRVWIRTFPLGGHHFTEAMVNAFKLPYAKAEKLKREAERSDHKRHVFQAMRPVFADLAQDVQRSIAYYHQLHPSADLKRVIGLGSTFRLMGLRKFLSQQLQLEVVRLDKLSRATIDGARASDFQAASLNMGTAYGLALQGLGLATIDVNLVPMSVIRESLWKQKTPWFVAAATLALAAGAASFYRPITDGAKVAQAQQSPERQQVETLKREGRTLMDSWKEVESSAAIGFAAENVRRLTGRRDLMINVLADLGAMLAAADPQPELLTDAASPNIPAGERRLLTVRSFTVDYVTPTGGAPTGPVAAPGERARPTAGGGSEGGGGGLGGGGGGDLGISRPSGEGLSRRGRQEQESSADVAPAGNPLGALRLRLVVESTHDGYLAFIDRNLLEWLRRNADRPGAPYKLEPPAIDRVTAERVTAPADPLSSRTGPAGVPAGAARRETAAGPPTSIDDLAPLAPPSPVVPPDAVVNRFTIEWRAVLREPPAPGAPADAEARGGAPEPGARLASGEVVR